MKKCPKCLVEKEETEFYKDKARKGLYPYCKECVKDSRKAAYRESPQKVSAKNKGYYIRNADKVKKSVREWALSNPDKVKEIHSRWVKNNPERAASHRHKTYLLHKEDKQAYNKKWKQENRHKTSAYSINRRAALLQRTPPWAVELTKKVMPALCKTRNELTKKTGVEHTIDHIIPLQGKLVSGLNVPWNLEVIPGPGSGGNYSKQNKFNLVKIDYKNGLPVTEGV